MEAKLEEFLSFFLRERVGQRGEKNGEFLVNFVIYLVNGKKRNSSLTSHSNQMVTLVTSFNACLTFVSLIPIHLASSTYLLTPGKLIPVSNT